MSGHARLDPLSFVAHPASLLVIVARTSGLRVETAQRFARLTSCFEEFEDFFVLFRREIGADAPYRLSCFNLVRHESNVRSRNQYADHLF